MQRPTRHMPGQAGTQSFPNLVEADSISTDFQWHGWHNWPRALMQLLSRSVPAHVHGPTMNSCWPSSVSLRWDPLPYHEYAIMMSELQLHRKYLIRAAPLEATHPEALVLAQALKGCKADTATNSAFLKATLSLHGASPTFHECSWLLNECCSIEAALVHLAPFGASLC